MAESVLVVVDMQNDFVNGALGTKEAEAIVPAVSELVGHFKGTVNPLCALAKFGGGFSYNSI